MKYIFTTYFSILFLFTYGQNISKNKAQSNFSYELDLGAGLYYQFSTFGNFDLNSVTTSKLLPRRANNPGVRNTWNLNNDLVSDNPFFHGSYFFMLGAKFQIGKSLTISSSINAEQRGFSDGVFSNRTRNFYPYLNAVFTNKVGKFSYLIQAGDFRNFKLYEGLTFDNLETQSWIFKLKYDKFYVKHAGVGDLLLGIGLGIDDLYDYSFGAEDICLNTDSTMNVNLRVGYSSNRRSFGGGFWNISANAEYNNLLKGYAQLSINSNNNIAFLLGLNLELEFANKFLVKGTVEYRTYNAGFNLGYNNTVFYRDPNEFASFANSTNNVFIPLDYFERNFMQWAVFTEYQNMNISGLNLKTDIEYQLSKKAFIRMETDLNWLSTKNEKIFYPFYNLGFGFRPLANTEVSLELTNKVLNLDKNYPTFYTSDTPYFMLRLYKPLEFVNENNLKHRI